MRWWLREKLTIWMILRPRVENCQESFVDIMLISRRRNRKRILKCAEEINFLNNCLLEPSIIILGSSSNIVKIIIEMLIILQDLRPTCNVL